MLAVPAALDFLRSWRQIDPDTGSDDDAASHNRRQLRSIGPMLANAFSTELPQPLSTISSMCMVQLPDSLEVADVPGVPGVGLRATLRDRYNIEAAIGTFPVQVEPDGRISAPEGDGEGNQPATEMRGFVRLSHAVYNRPKEYEIFRDAILEILAEQS